MHSSDVKENWADQKPQVRMQKSGGSFFPRECYVTLRCNGDSRLVTILCVAARREITIHYPRIDTGRVVGGAPFSHRWVNSRRDHVYTPDVTPFCNLGVSCRPPLLWAQRSLSTLPRKGLGYAYGPPTTRQLRPAGPPYTYSCHSPLRPI
jgi:hypothetical protein